MNRCAPILGSQCRFELERIGVHAGCETLSDEIGGVLLRADRVPFDAILDCFCTLEDLVFTSRKLCPESM